MARFTYTSTEDGQVIESDTRLDHLEGLARWVAVDSQPESEASAPEFGWDSMSPNPEPVAGSVNTEPVTGGEPPLVSAGAGFSNPAEILSAEEAAAKSAADLLASAPQPESEATADDEAEEEPTDKWSVADIKAYAEREGIDLEGAKNKDEYLKVIGDHIVITTSEPSDAWTIDQLTAYAVSKEIDLDGATLKAEILEKVAPTQ